MSKLKQIKIPIDLGVFKPKWRLVRSRDGLTKESEEIGFIEWGENDNSKLHKGIEGLEIGRSLIMSPFNILFTWQTTEIIDFNVREEGGWKFNTKNSEYVLINVSTFKTIN